MKIKIPLIVVLVFYFASAFGQNNDHMLQTDLHKYLTYEAWKLVKRVHPIVTCSEMNTRVGAQWNVGDINGEGPWQVGKIITGAYREDKEDVVYGYLGANITSTHFWDADHPDGVNSKFYPFPFTYGYENAFVKMNAYWQGRKDGNTPWLILGPYFYLDAPFWIRVAYIDNEDNNFASTNLAEAYKNKDKFKVTSWLNFYTNQWEAEDPPQAVIPFLQKNIFPQQYSEAEGIALLNRVTWEIVGRMCHLIEDSGVPAHAHNNVHAFSELYENTFTPAHYQIYDNNLAVLQAQQLNQPLLSDLMSKNNPFLYTMYTTNQVADRFASDGCTTPLGCPPTEGDLDYTPYTPPIPGQNSDYVNDIIGPIYQNVLDVDPDPTYISPAYCQIVAENSFLYSMRSTASFLWYVYQKFNIQGSTPPEIYNVVCSVPDNCVYRGEGIRLYCHSNNAPNITYSWEYVPCSDDQCNANIQGITITPQGNTLLIQNSNYQSLSCDNCAQTDLVPTALYYKIKVTATTPNCPPVTYEYLEPQHGIVPVAANRPGGCPYVYVQNDSGKFISDNNILHRSEFTENVGLDISDKYLLNVKPGVFDDKISMDLFESTHDISSINSVKLLAVDHPIGTKLGITENNDIIMYYDEDAESPKNAEKNHIENITSLVQYNIGNGNRHDTVSGIPTDDIINEFDIPTLRSKLLSSRDKFSRIRNGSLRGSSDSTALIMKIGLNPDLDRPPVWTPVAKRPAGNITLTSDANVITTQFARRESPSLVIIPFGVNTSIEKADISWERDFGMYYAAVVDVFYSGFDVTELPLSEALNSANQNLLEDLQNIDGYFATLDTTGIIMLKFDNVENTSGMIRDYVLVTDGQYAASVGAQLRNGNIKNDVKTKTESNTIGFTNKLNANFPNPFNPTTKINYQIKRDGFVSLKIYNVVGQLVKELVGEYKNAGNYIVEFNGSYLASGTYYYRIESNDFIETKKMILIK